MNQQVVGLAGEAGGRQVLLLLLAAFRRGAVGSGKRSRLAPGAAPGQVRGGRAQSSDPWARRGWCKSELHNAAGSRLPGASGEHSGHLG